MSSQFGFLGFLLLQFSVLAIVFVVLCDIVQRSFGFNHVLTVSAAVLALGLAGYGSFWLAYLSYAVFAPFKIVCLVGFVIYFAAIVRRRELSRLSWLAEPLLYVFLFAVAVLGLGFSNGGLNDPPLTSSIRFMDWLPPDNVLPMFVADWLRGGRVALSPLREWLVSDRPPLQTGFYLLLALKFHDVSYQFVASWLQATFLLGVWALAGVTALSTAARRTVMLACCLLPTTILNTLYTWPKILPAGYLLFVFVLLFGLRPGGLRESRAAGVLLGGMAALAMLGHGGSAFALIGFAIVLVAMWRWPSLRVALPAMVSFGVLYTPWLLYQRYIDPPGNRLLKWHLGGIEHLDPRGLLEIMRSSYGALGWHDYLDGRLANFAIMIGDWPSHLWAIARLAFNHDVALAKIVRSTDFFQLLPSLHGFSIALVAALALLPLLPATAPQRRIALLLLAALGATVTVAGVLLFIPGSAINHQTTFALQIMATAFAFVVLSQGTPGLALALLMLQLVTVTTAYALTVPHDPDFWPTGLVGFAAAAALLVYSLMPMAIRRPGPALGWRRNSFRFRGLLR